jgi:hypothetical protein
MEDEITVIIRVKPVTQEIEKRKRQQAKISGQKVFQTPRELAEGVAADAFHHSFLFELLSVSTAVPVVMHHVDEAIPEWARDRSKS